MGKVLVACEYSDTVSTAFRALGHNVTSCDLLPSENPEANHVQGDVRPLLRERWDLVIAHPPCTHLSGLHDAFPHNKQRPGFWDDFFEAVDFFHACLAANAPRVAVENPTMHKEARIVIGKPDMVVQPFHFGDNAKKRTAFWCVGLPPLMATQIVSNAPHTVAMASIHGKKRIGPTITSGWDYERRQKDRARFHPGMAAAMARQWGGLIM